jgi:Flp pilus assembly protein TadD
MGLHVGSLFFLPSLIALLIGKNQIRAMLATVVVIGLSGVGVLAISGGGLSLENLVQRVQSALLFDFLSLQSPSSAGAYAILSRAHLVDWANALMMNAPFAPLGILFILISWNRLWDTHKVLLIFLLTASACGVLFTLVFNPGLGMARDWDLLSVFFLPTSFLTLLGLVTTLKARHLRHALVILVILRMLRAGAWFGVNANEEDHIARAEMLTAPELSGPIHKYYYEAVADVYWKRSNFDKARHWYELYCLDDSTNTRIIGNLASCYEILGDTIKEEATLARAAALGSSNPGVYSNLGLRLIRRGQIDSAIVYLEKSLRLKPSFAVAHANLAAAYRRIQRFDLTAEHAVSAIRFGMNKPPLYKTAAIAYRECGKESLALAYVDAYIKQVPQDGWGRRMREELVTALNRSRR